MPREHARGPDGPRWAPVTCEQNGNRNYEGASDLIANPLVLHGCGGPQSPKSTRLGFALNVVRNFCFRVTTGRDGWLGPSIVRVSQHGGVTAGGAKVAILAVRA